MRCVLAASTLPEGKEAAKAALAAVASHREEFEFDRHCSGPNLVNAASKEVQCWVPGSLLTLLHSKFLRIPMSQGHPLCLVLIGGSLRSQSVNGAVIATAAEMTPSDSRAVIYRRLGDLPHFNPDNDHDPLPEPVADLREQLKGADAVLFSTPEYAGSLPGSFKNMLDWTVGGSGVYGIPVGWINPSAHGGSQDTYHALRIVLSRAGANIVESACIDIPVSRDAVGTDGFIANPEIRAAISRLLGAFLEAARSRRETVALSRFLTCAHSP